MLPRDYVPGQQAPPGGERQDADALVIANEFSEVVVRRVQTGNGVRLAIEAPRLGRRVLLDAMQLEGLTAQTPETFSRFLENATGH